MRLFAALALLAQAQAGQKTTIHVQSELELDVVVRDGTGETTRLLNLLRKEEFEQEVSEVAGGQPTSVLIRCLSSTLQRSGTDVPIEVKPTKLARMTFRSLRGEKGWTAQDAAGGAPPIEGQSLGAWNDVSRLLPKTELKAGDRWQVDAAELAALIYPSGLREPTGALTCTCSNAGGGAASIQFTGTLAGKGKEDASIAVAITAGRLELSGGRPKELTVRGSLQSTLDIVDVFRKPNENEEERKKVGEINVKSRKLEVSFLFN